MSNWKLPIAVVVLVTGYAVRVEAAPTVLNAGFETDTYLNGPGGTAGQNGDTITGWTIAGGTSQVGLNPFWTDGSRTAIAGTPHANNGVVPEGDQVAFLRSAASLSQIVSGFDPGTAYRLRYRENNRAGHSPGGLAVTLGGQVIVADHATTNVQGAGSFTVPYRTVVSDVFVATASAHTLSCTSTSGLDRSVLIDDVQIAPLSDALIAHWTLDETSGQTAFDSAGGNDGQLGTSPGVDAADPTINQPGKFGTAYSFTAGQNDRVDLSAHIGGLSSLATGTITGWFNASDSARGGLLNFGQAGTTDRMLVEMLGNGRIRFLVREADANVTDLETSASFEDGAWHHVAVTNDGTDTTLLIDGVEVPLGTNTDSASWFDDVTGVTSFTLGYETRTNGQFPFNGSLDDFAVFDYVLTSEQLSNVITLGAENFQGLGSVIPEPMTVLAAGLSVAGLGGYIRRRRRG